jgi:GT2 family glycosyltransferase
MADVSPELVVIIVSYNTKALTLKCIATVIETTRRTDYRIVVIDNASHDGSADAIAERFPDIELIRSAENLGFARANNVVAEQVEAPWLLLLNPDTECHPGAIDNLMDFARARPANGIYGGRTVFPDGSLNFASCWNRITPWSAFCHATGLSTAFRDSPVFNTEAIGGWRRDSVREVDIVVGCFFLIPQSLWRRLGGFNLKYWMFGEEADLCLRARAMGCRPIITPDAVIMHIGGASSATRAEKASKTALVAKARLTLTRDHWPAFWRPWAVAMMWLWAANRRLASAVAARLRGGEWRQRCEAWRQIWSMRRDWLAGY